MNRIKNGAVVMTTPFGFRTLANSAIAFSGFGRCSRTSVHRTVSTELSERGI